MVNIIRHQAESPQNIGVPAKMNNHQ